MGGNVLASPLYNVIVNAVAVMLIYSSHFGSCAIAANCQANAVTIVLLCSARMGQANALTTAVLACSYLKELRIGSGQCSDSAESTKLKVSETDVSTRW
eukprot:sb/3478652/